MSCERWREAVSAEADGEDPGVDRRLLDAHLQRCPSCSRFRTEIEQSRRAFRVSEAPVIPDLSKRVVKLNAIADRAARWGIVRGLLAVCAAQIMVLSAPALVLGDESGTSPHGARHLGAFTVAYAVGLLIVAVRPARARTMLPVAVVLGIALIVSGMFDVLDDATGPLGEIAHVPELLSVVLVWLLARPSLVPRRTGLTLMSVEDGDDEQHRDAI